jgi:hypothetical protein
MARAQMIRLDRSISVLVPSPAPPGRGSRPAHRDILREPMNYPKSVEDMSTLFFTRMPEEGLHLP